MIIFIFLYKNLKHQGSLEFYLKIMNQNRIRSFLASHAYGLQQYPHKSIPLIKEAFKEHP